jgi:hypothetical protein
VRSRRQRRAAAVPHLTRRHNATHTTATTHPRTSSSRWEKGLGARPGEPIIIPLRPRPSAEARQYQIQTPQRNKQPTTSSMQFSASQSPAAAPPARPPAGGRARCPAVPPAVRPAAAAPAPSRTRPGVAGHGRQISVPLASHMGPFSCHYERKGDCAGVGMLWDALGRFGTLWDALGRTPMRGLARAWAAGQVNGWPRGNSFAGGPAVLVRVPARCARMDVLPSTPVRLQQGGASVVYVRNCTVTARSSL